MADIAARREARRRRILENSENRLQKITGRSNEGPINERISTKEDITSLGNDAKDFEHQDQNSDLKKNTDLVSDEQFQELDDLSTQYNLRNVENRSKENGRNCDNLKFNSNFTSLNEQYNTKQLSQDIFLYNILISPILLVIFAACLNILFLMNINFSIYTGIIIPYILLITTQLCLGKSEDVQGSSMLAATLVLCNIKPEIVHTFKKLFIHFNIIVKNLALFITSFIFINWITTTFLYNSRQIQYF